MGFCVWVYESEWDCVLPRVPSCKGQGLSVPERTNWLSSFCNPISLHIPACVLATPTLFGSRIPAIVVRRVAEPLGTSVIWYYQTARPYIPARFSLSKGQSPSFTLQRTFWSVCGIPSLRLAIWDVSNIVYIHTEDKGSSHAVERKNLTVLTSSSDS
jgi:hypothetical protein